jgi:hypothetical protein
MNAQETSKVDQSELWDLIHSDYAYGWICRQADNDEIRNRAQLIEAVRAKFCVNFATAARAVALVIGENC